MIASDDTGYLQTKFSITCKCGKQINKDILGVAKFIKDLVSSDNPSSSHIEFDKLLTDGFIA